MTGLDQLMSEPYYTGRTRLHEAESDVDWSDDGFFGSQASEDGADSLSGIDLEGHEAGPRDLRGSANPSTHVYDETLEEAEGEIAGDFDRIVQNIKESDMQQIATGQPAPWDFSIAEEEDFNPDLEHGVREGAMVRARKRVRRPRGEVELSHQVKALIGEAAAAFVDRDLVRTMEICREVVRIEPAAYAAWNTLSLVHEELNEPEVALKLKIMAAHLQGDAELWGELGRASREAHQMQQALYCFRKAVSLNPKDVDALWDRSVMLREIGENRAAMNGFISILKITPHHMGVLRQLGYLFSVLSEFQKGIRFYQEALSFYQRSMATGPGELEAGDCLLLIVTLADFCNTIGEYEQAVTAVRDGARWLQGWGTQKYWATLADDREFDTAGYVRQATGEEGASRAQGNFALDPNLRHRLCLARLALGDLEEGQMHGSLVLAQDIMEYSSLFHEIATAYFGRGLHGAALPIFEELAAREETSSVDIIMHIAACHRHLGDFDRAVEVYEYVLNIDPDHNEVKMRLAEVFEILNQPRKALNLVNEVLAARNLQREKEKQSADDPGLGEGETAQPPRHSLFEEKKRVGPKKNTLPIETIQRLEKERQDIVDRSFRKLAALNSSDKSDKEEWSKEAAMLTDMFRETRELFGGNRFSQYRGSINERRLERLKNATDREQNESDMASRLQLELSSRNSKDEKEKKSGFRGHDFEEWLTLFIRYAFTLTKDGKYTLAAETLKHVLFSNAYADFTSQTTIRVALLACSTYEKDHAAIVEQSRKLMFTHQFHNDPIRLMFACLGGGYRAVDAFIDTNFQKHLNRELKFTSMAAEGGHECTWVPGRNRWAIKGKGKDTAQDEDEEDDGDPDDVDDGPEPSPPKVKSKYPTASAVVGANPSPTLATKENPILFTMYAQLSSCAKSYQSALFYLFQAYDIQSNDTVVCLSLAVASLSRAMQRQADNRQHLITQGLAFLSRYRTLRSGEEHIDEVEYNFGRTFHHLGIFHLAVKHYEQVLANVQKRLDANPSQDVGLAKESAYNLMLIYSTTGGTAMARDLALRWLSV